MPITQSRRRFPTMLGLAGASRLVREAGTIKSSPQKIIADGTDWQFVNELKRELKV